jgi:ribonuclease Z
MKLTFLGTSAGKPTKERALTAIALEFNQSNNWYLFDCGEATQFQLLHSKLSVGKLEAIFITHLHGDHFYGLPGLLASKKIDGALKPLTIYGPKGIKKFITYLVELTDKDIGYELTIIEYKPYQEFTFDKFVLKVLPVIHSVDSVAFYIKENDKSNQLDEVKLRAIGLEPSPLYGKLKSGQTIMHKNQKIIPEKYMLEPKKGKSLIISGDNAKVDILSDYLQDLDLLIHECTYTQEVFDNLKKKILHTTARDLGIVSDRYNIKNLIATHISPRYHRDGKFTIKMIEEEIRQNYENILFIANDFDIFELNDERLLQKIQYKNQQQKMLRILLS